MIKREFPPNFEQIKANFPVKAGVIYTYAPHIYHPFGTGRLDDALMIHEQVHLAQQGENPAAWWDRYIEDAEFRLVQEYEAHLAEFEHRKAVATNRHQRRGLLKIMSRRLSDPLYGKLISRRDAEVVLKRGYLYEPRTQDQGARGADGPEASGVPTA